MLIDVDLGLGYPCQLEESQLQRRNSTVDNGRERTQVTEYLFNEKVVHRSVHVQLKQGIGIEGIFGSIG